MLQRKLATLIVGGLFIMSSCAVTNKIGERKHIYVQQEGREDKKWKLVWQDDFNGTVIDTSKWTRIPAGSSDWNRHMSIDDACFKMENGKLHLLGINNPDTSVDPRPYLTGGIWSKGKFAFQYGRVEIRAKLGSAQGAWPAMWMLAELDKYGKYPRNGEIDIMEHLNFDKIIYQTTHSYYTLDLGEKTNPPHHGTAQIDAGVYNTYGISWYPDRIVFQLNGKDTFTYPRVEGVDASQWPYDQPFFLLIDQQLGGSWVGEVDRKQLPVEMVIDWVKVYQ
ncbi:glycoside hydrolase family 16 protein [Sphingobacterium sp. UT-1RO-CII-1]|uniref:glycoside hydrolase family 16 protein n=1 Tax=Sphingobacterium sp. UT-1RO-CII-1 TaxID=2995225 RepID=UPI00227C7200|nr:glycoside hydrolase family 16 protein [Sphingobacterium sp. UT-1RO-CII-1]MCY4781218.1 glycoside hydrolase family 16 protein [Sphingobacterium sp. UT-1RO-CII-1]